MSRLFAASWAIARRDFVATVWSRTFLLFLLAPLIAAGFGALIAGLTAETDAAAARPAVAVALAPGEAEAVRSAYKALRAAVGPQSLPRVKFSDPSPDPAAQARMLLSSKEAAVSGVLTGSLDRPTLSGPPGALRQLGPQIAFLLDRAREARALGQTDTEPSSVQLAKVATGESGGSRNMVEHGLARGSQLLVFMLTLMLATMLLSNLVEEKSSKVIEVLAAAVPLDAVFLGKLIAMLGVSLVGVLVWGGLAASLLLFVQERISLTVTPAIGWPVFSLLAMLYFAANYMLLGAVFLGIGGQASNVREVQTLSMPITFLQVMVFLLASMAVGNPGGALTWAAAAFPLSSPLAMLSVAAQSASPWPHVAALLWQLLWIFLIIRFAARMFRRTVLKSGSADSLFATLRSAGRCGKGSSR